MLSTDGLTHLHDAMTRHVEAGEMPGLVALVARGDDVHVDIVGRPSFADPAPLDRSAIFRIASLTKPITAAATMTLVEEGVLRLDQAVEELLPELAEPPGAARHRRRPRRHRPGRAADHPRGPAQLPVRLRVA